jgi:hypothetical protein
MCIPLTPQNLLEQILQIQRLVQQVGAAAQTWQEREALRPLPEAKPVPILYVSGDATGAPMRKEELEGRKGKQPDGAAKTRSAYLGCVFTQHKTDEKGHPARDYESTTYVSNMGPLEEFGPLLRQEAIRRGLGQANKVVLALRCIHASRRRDQFWKERLNAHAAENDWLSLAA